MLTIKEYLSAKTYPGRGILLGRSACGEYAYVAYFIMGRSENSKNRVFVAENEVLRTKAFDESKLMDPSLVIYAPIRVLGDTTIVTNGDQTDTIFDAMTLGGSFSSALDTREFEPDPPIFTPRISGYVQSTAQGFAYGLSILKTEDEGESCSRFFYRYNSPKCGEGRIIHTYVDDGNPPQSFAGEPVQLALDMDFESFAGTVWESLDANNKISAVARKIGRDGHFEQIVFNKNA